MPAQQRSTGPAVSVTVINSASQLPGGRDSARTFGATERLLRELFERKGLTGEFRLLADHAIRGSNAKKGMHLNLVDQGRIKLSVQPNGNDTAWVYWLMPPPNLTAEELYQKLKKGGKKPKREAPKLQAVPEAPPEPEAPEPAPKPDANPVRDFLEDMDCVALALLDLFPKCESMPPRAVVVEELETQMDWDVDKADQAVRGLINRGCLKEVELRGETHISVIGAKLCGRLSVLGGIRKSDARAASVAARKPEVPKPVCTPRVVPLPARTATKPRAPAPAAVVRKPDPAPTPPVQPAFAGGAALETLARKAQMFANAQKSLASADPAVDALKTKRQRLSEELTQVEQDLAELEAGRASAIAVLSDPSYSAAAVKMAQITALITQ